MAHSHIEHSEGHSSASHALPVMTYISTYVALMVLMIATIIVARYDLGPWNIWIALVIAITKATLVVLIFMGVKYNTKLTWLWASVGFIWLLLLFGTLGDYITREWVRLPYGW